MGPTVPRSTVLTPAEEAMIVEFQRRTLIRIDDVLGCLRDSIANLIRLSLHRCLERHGISRLPDNPDKASKRGKFADVPIGYVHIDISELRLAIGKVNMFLALACAARQAMALERRIVNAAARRPAARPTYRAPNPRRPTITRALHQAASGHPPGARFARGNGSPAGPATHRHPRSPHPGHHPPHLQRLRHPHRPGPRPRPPPPPPLRSPEHQLTTHRKPPHHTRPRSSCKRTAQRKTEHANAGVGTKAFCFFFSKKKALLSSYPANTAAHAQP